MADQNNALAPDDAPAFSDEEIQRALDETRKRGTVAPGPDAFSDDEINSALDRYNAVKNDPALRGFLSQRLEQADLMRFRDRPLLADDYLTATVGRMGKPGLNDARARALVSLVDPNNETEIASAIRKVYPNAQTRFVPVPADHQSAEAGQRVLMFKLSPRDLWARFDEPGFTGHDIADLTGAAPQIAGEILGAKGAGMAVRALGRIAPGMGTTLMGGALGAGAGEAAASETLQGLGIRAPESASATLARGADATVQSAIAGTLFYGGAQIARAATGGLGLVSGPTTVGDAGLKALAAEKALRGEARRVGVEAPPPLTAAQLAESPVSQRLASLASTVVKRVGQTVERQLTRTRELISARNQTPAMRVELDNIETSTRQQIASWRTRAVDLISRRAILPREGGIEARDAIEAWRLNSQQLVSQLYDEAEAIAPLYFDISPLLTWRQTFNARRAAGEIREVPPSLARTISQVDQIIATTQGSGRGTLMTSQPLPDGSTLRAWETLDSARSNAFSSTLQNPAELRTTQDIVVARDLQRVLGEVLDNPVASSVSDTARWRGAVNDARNAARQRFDDIRTFEALAQARAYEFRPEPFARSLMNPTDDSLPRQVHKMLTDMGMPGRWEAVQNGVHGELLHMLQTSPKSVTNWLDQWRDPATRRLFMTPAEEQSWRNAANEMDEINSLNWEAITHDTVNHTTAVLDMIAKNDVKGVRRLLAEPANSPQRRAIRAGMLDHLASLRTEHKGIGATFQAEIPDVEAIKSTLAQWEKTGADRLLTAEDRKFMTDAWRYASFASGRRGDTGASIAGTEMASGLIHPARFVDSVLTWGRMLTYGWMITSPAFRRLLIGFRPGSSAKTNAAIPLVGQILGDIKREFEEQPAGGSPRGPIHRTIRGQPQLQ